MRPDLRSSAPWLLFLTIALGACGSLLAAAEASVPAIMLMTAASVCVVLGVRCAFGNWATLSLLFCLFFALYGLSGAHAAIAGDRLADLFAFPYRVNAFLLQQGLATIGLAFGLLLGVMLHDIYRGASGARAHSSSPPGSHGIPFAVAVALIAVGSTFELITLIRVGGLPVLAMGKAAYQSRAAELSPSLPSLEAVSMGVALGALWFGRHGQALSRSQRFARMGAMLLAGLPAFTITLALGQRGPLFGWVLMWIVGRSVHRPLRRLPMRLLVSSVLLVFASGVLFASRATLGFAVGTGDWQPFLAAVSDAPRVMAALNPADSEFGAAFGNFSEYEAAGEHSRRWGATYVAGLSTLIPGALYPGTKPRTITYEFRDRHFPAEASRGAIAGTGFSSILEAHTNFGSAGVLGMYTLVGVLLTCLERLTTGSARDAAFYLQLIPVTQIFHRSELSTALGTAMMAALLVATVEAILLARRLLLAAPSSHTQAVSHV